MDITNPESNNVIQEYIEHKHPKTLFLDLSYVENFQK